MDLYDVAEEWKRCGRKYTDHGHLDLRKMAETYVKFFGTLKSLDAWAEVLQDVPVNQTRFAIQVN